MSNQKALEILNRFNENGWEDMQPYFGDFTTFYNYMKKNELSNSLNINDIPDEFLNGLLLAKLQENPEETIKYVIENYLTDVGIFSNSPSFFGTYDQTGPAGQGS
jgi:hypothetical protein